MRSRRPASEHEEAVSRRLAQLSAELSAARLEGTPSRDEQVAPAAGGEWWADHTRVSPSRAALALVPDSASPSEQPPASPAAPYPEHGRHCARPRSRSAGFLPQTLQGKVFLGPGQVASVAVIVALAMVLTAWWAVRADPREVAPDSVAQNPVAPLVDLPQEEASPGEAPESAAPGASPPIAEGSVTVDVAGKVRRPGIAVLDAGARVVDALEAAGGSKPRVDLTSINLARVLVDGEQIVVGARVAPAPPPSAPPGTPESGAGAPSGLVNLNLAGLSELESLPQVGPVTAAAIIAWRDQAGGFTSVDELLEVDGIGEKTLAQIAPFATV